MVHPRLRALLVVSLCLLPLAPARAQAPAGTQGTLTVGIGCQYPTVGAALAAASRGDTLFLKGGAVFTENLTIDESLTLLGGSGCGGGTTGHAVLNGGDSGRVLYINKNLTVALQHLEIKNGYTSGNGAGVFANAGTLLTIIDTLIHANEALGNGGGLRLLGATAVMTATRIYANQAANGAGIYASWVDPVTATIRLMDGTRISAHSDSETSIAHGGGVYLEHGSLEMSGCVTISTNIATWGGGVYLSSAEMTMRGACALIDDNGAYLDGGGVYAQDSTVNLLLGPVISDNTAGDNGYGSGGGLALNNSDLLADQAWVVDNDVYLGEGGDGNGGGGIYAINGSTIYFDLVTSPCRNTRCNQLSGNGTSYGGWGAGLFLQDSTAAFVQTYIDNNQARGSLDSEEFAYGGAVYAVNSIVVLNNTMVTGNSDNSGVGGLLLNNSQLLGDQVTIAYNANPALNANFAVMFIGPTQSLTLRRSIIWGHEVSISASTTQTVTCSDIEGGYTGADNRNQDPGFISAAGGDYHLRPDSDVTDRCEAGLPADIDNQPRPVLLIDPARRYDMGADEVWLSLSLPLTLSD